jgi:hypothetical protein
LEQNPITFYHISLPDRREEKGVPPLLRQETEKVLKTASFYTIGMAPDEEVCKGKLRNRREKSGEKFIEEGFFFEGKVFKLRKFCDASPYFLHVRSNSFCFRSA